ncbi:MAG TPA: hypothetical protein DCR24_09490 [Bacillus bacterium]|nr:hypothetical protein [Bacillus sp. (in: firmicutes)]
MMDHQMHNQMPQLGGMMQGQMPHMPQLGGMMNHQMPHQMPQVGGMMQQPNMPKQAVQGLEKDCGCGDTMGQQMGNPYGSMGPGFHQPQHGYPVGYGQPGLMHPYGAGPGSFGMPRFDEESNEY